MKVKEAIEKLSQYPEDMEICVRDIDGCFHETSYFLESRDDHSSKKILELV